jgi:hypothetical protein
LLERQALLKPKSKGMIRLQISYWKKAQSTLKILMEEFLPSAEAEQEYQRHISLEQTI